MPQIDTPSDISLCQQSALLPKSISFPICAVSSLQDSKVNQPPICFHAYKNNDLLTRCEILRISQITCNNILCLYMFPVRNNLFFLYLKAKCLA